MSKCTKICSDQTYRSCWEELSPFKGWLEAVSGSPHEAFCKWCKQEMNADRNVLLLHSKSREHQLVCSATPNSEHRALEGSRLDSSTSRKQKIHNIGLLTISDSCWTGAAIDTSGPALKKVIEDGTFIQGMVTCEAICPDERDEIKNFVTEWCNTKNLDLIITTGGTGVSHRDVTPEAIKEVLDKEVPGLAIRMISESLRITPLAMLSRPICGVKNSTLIITLPGSKKACVECLSFVAPALMHAIHLIKDDREKVKMTHDALQGRPSSVDQPVKVELLSVPMRNRVSPYPMISVEEAQSIVLEQAEVSKSVQKMSLNCLNYVLANDIVSKLNIPPAPVSKMDGYAVLSSDGMGQRTVLGSNTAGDKVNGRTVTPGCCIRISTGAFLPKGADAVVQVEDTDLIKVTEDQQEEEVISINSESCNGQNIRQIGADMIIGELLIKTGSVISPSDVGILVSSGNTTAGVHPKPKVAIMSTGNELQDFDGSPLKEGCIFDCNRPTLKALMAKYADEIHDIGIARDTAPEVRSALTRAFLKADVVITSGGVSMGERDILKPILESDFGAKIWFGRVCMKPGKPTTFATCKFNNSLKFILALPGNPVSAVVAATLFALPLCRKISGVRNLFGTTIKVKLSDEVRLDQKRWEYCRVKLDWKSNVPEAVATGIQESSRLMSLSSASALLKLPPGAADRQVLLAGDEVDALLLDF